MTRKARPGKPNQSVSANRQATSQKSKDQPTRQQRKPPSSQGQASDSSRSRSGKPQGRRSPAPRDRSSGETSHAAAAPSTPPPHPKSITIPESITVRDLAQEMNVGPIEVIRILMNYGIMAPITEAVDFETAFVVGEELGVEIQLAKPPEPETPAEPEGTKITLRQELQKRMETEERGKLQSRPPVVTVLGHVDHGKTTLLDAIRSTNVVDGESGGITQHIGAYQVEVNGRKITFLDTPGHEAFTAMRARGADVTDLAVLVIAATDGVMPQTKEAIDHARAAQVPILVALNKMDRPGANPERVKQELADLDLVPGDWGGDVLVVPISAKFKQGIEELLEDIVLVTEVADLKANPDGAAIGTVIEAKLDKSRGPVATLLVQSGTLHQGDIVLVGTEYGRVRAMFDYKGETITAATPATPAAILGLPEVPVAGDVFKVVPDERTARSEVAARGEQQREAEAQPTPQKVVSLDEFFAQMQNGKAKQLNLILKTDVQGSIEPIERSLQELSSEEVSIKILHKGIGNITESDVMLAIASKAIIIGFDVTVEPAAQKAADAEGVDIRIYDIIYKLSEDVDKALKGLLEPVYEDVVIGHATIRAIFHIPQRGKIAGCYVTNGIVTRNALARISRANETIYNGRLSSLKHFRDDVNEVKTGFECGIGLEGFQDFKVGDVIELYKKERVR